MLPLVALACLGQTTTSQIGVGEQVLMAPPQTGAASKLEHLRCEYLVEPRGIGITAPRLSWIITCRQRSEKQTAYQVLVASSRVLLEKDQGDLWDSGKVGSDETSQISYAGSRLSSRKDCFWKVRIWDRESRPT